MKKVYKRLTADQKARSVIFSSTLSEYREEMQGDTIHEVKADTPDRDTIIKRLKDDKFFNDSSFKFNIIRQ